MRLVGIAVVALTLAGCGVETAPPDDATTGFPEEPLTRVTSDSGRLDIELRTAPTQPPGRGVLTLEYVVADGATPRDDLDLVVTPWMPAMGHGTSLEPTVEARGDGHYVVSDVSLSMPGTWELRTTLRGATDDHATIEIAIP